MAKLSDLTRALAAVSSRSETTIAVTARSLREAGLIPTGGRGVNAPQMASRDGAALLVGLACPGDHTKVGQYAPQAGILKLEALVYAERNDIVGSDELGGSLGVTRGQSLFDALAALIDHYRLEQPSVTKRPFDDVPPLFGYQPVVADAPPETVEICVTTDGVDWNAEIVVGRATGGPLRLRFSKYGDASPPQGPKTAKPDYLEVFSTTLKPRTFHAAVNCIRHDEAPFRAEEGRA